MRLTLAAHLRLSLTLTMRLHLRLRLRLLRESLVFLPYPASPIPPHAILPTAAISLTGWNEGDYVTRQAHPPWTSHSALPGRQTQPSICIPQGYTATCATLTLTPTVRLRDAAGEDTSSSPGHVPVSDY